MTTEGLVEDLIAATGQLLRRMRAESNPVGLTWSQAVALARLEKSGTMTTADLARAEGVKPQSMGATMSGLEKDGLVERQPHPTDGRQALYHLTKHGIETQVQHRLRKREWLASAIANLDEQERTSLSVALEVFRRLGSA